MESRYLPKQDILKDIIFLISLNNLEKNHTDFFEGKDLGPFQGYVTEVNIEEGWRKVKKSNMIPSDSPQKNYYNKALDDKLRKIKEKIRRSYVHHIENEDDDSLKLRYKDWVISDLNRLLVELKEDHIDFIEYSLVRKTLNDLLKVVREHKISEEDICLKTKKQSFNKIKWKGEEKIFFLLIGTLNRLKIIEVQDREKRKHENIFEILYSVFEVIAPTTGEEYDLKTFKKQCKKSVLNDIIPTQGTYTPIPELEKYLSKYAVKGK